MSAAVCILLCTAVANSLSSGKLALSKYAPAKLFCCKQAASDDSDRYATRPFRSMNGVCVMEHTLLLAHNTDLCEFLATFIMERGWKGEPELDMQLGPTKALDGLPMPSLALQSPDSCTEDFE